MTLDRERCLTCADEAVTASVVGLADGDAVVELAGTRERVAIELVPDAAPGDVLLCHAGVALARVEPQPR